MADIFKGLSRYAPDMARRVRVPASGNREIYQRTLFTTVAVNDSSPTPLSPARLPVISFSVQASPDNIVSIVMGGPAVMASSGFRLAPGAVLSAHVTETDLLQWALSKGQPSGGPEFMAREDEMRLRAGLTRPFDENDPHLVCNLADFALLALPAGGAAQSAVVSWTAYPRILYRR
jgi:hypothetical protein